MTRSVIFLAALMLTFALFFGSFQGFVFCNSLLSDDLRNYCKASAPNVGVTGLQTLLVSFFVVVVADRVRQTADDARRGHDLTMKRRSRLAINFQDLLEYRLNKLLYDFDILNGSVSWKDIRDAHFVKKDRASRLIGVKIINSDLRNVMFGTARTGCTFENVEFIGGALRNVSFRNCSIRVIRTDKPFMKGTECHRLDFRNATLNAVDLSEVSVKGALFWGAKIVGFSQMPGDQEKAFREFVKPVTDSELGRIHQVMTLRAVLSEVPRALFRGKLRDGMALLHKVLAIEWRHWTA